MALGVLNVHNNARGDAPYRTLCANNMSTQHNPTEPARVGQRVVLGAGLGLSSVRQIGVHGCGGRLVGLFVLGLQRLVELAGEGGDTVHPGQDLGRDGTVESHLHVDRAAGDGVAGLGSAPFSVKLMWELGWLYVGERRLWTLHLVSWPTDAKTSPTRYQPLTV